MALTSPERAEAPALARADAIVAAVWAAETAPLRAASEAVWAKAAEALAMEIAIVLTVALPAHKLMQVGCSINIFSRPSCATWQT